MQKIVNLTDISEFSFPKAYLYAIHQVHTFVARHMEKKLGLSSALSFSQFWVLVCFIDCKDEEEQTAAVVAKKMFISEATLSGHIERMYKAKLILKKQNAGNKRKVIITLTDKGKQEFAKAKKIIDTELNKIFNIVKPTDRKKVIHSFQDVLQILFKLKTN